MLRNIRWNTSEFLQSWPRTTIFAIMWAVEICILYIHMHDRNNYTALLSMFCFIFSFLVYAYIHEKDLLFHRFLGFKVYKIKFSPYELEHTILPIREKCEELGVKYNDDIDHSMEMIHITFPTEEDFNLLILTLDQKLFEFSPSILS